MEKKILVVCYSFSNGNTRMIAKQLQQADINAWIERVKKAISGWKAYEIQNTSENR